MAGTLAALPLAIQLDSNARPLSGCLLYLYDAGTSTPSVFYEDFGLTVTLSWPLVGDAAGRIPNFWVADGSYRVRLTDSAGNEIFDINAITAIGPSSGGASGGPSVSANQIFQTGDTLWVPAVGTRSGWVRHNALTIGSSSSGATERANADCQSLFELVWNTFSDSICPVTTGRGSSALNDWNANKRIKLLDLRASTVFGVNDMGNSDGGWLSPDIGTGTEAGASGGNPLKTILQTNLPNVNFSHSLTASADGVHNHQPSGGSNFATFATGINFGPGATGTCPQTGNAFTSSDGLHTHAVTGTIPSGGSGTQLNIMPFYTLGTWFVKL